MVQGLIIVPCYRVHGLTLRLPIAVDGFLPAVADAAPDIDVTWADAPEPDLGDGSAWREIRLEQDRRSYPIYRAWQHREQGYLWHCAGPTRTIKYRMPADLRRIEIWRDATLSPLRLVRPAFGQALAFLLRARGSLLLHAAAIEVAGRAVLLVGASGQGKSTLAFEMIRQGCGFLSDDMAMPDLSGVDPVVHVGHRVVKLMPDSVTNFATGEQAAWAVAPGGIKREAPVAMHGVAGACPVAAIVLLEPRGQAGPVALETVAPGDALVALSAQIHPRYLPVGSLDRGELPKAFQQLSQLLGRVQVMRLSRPDRLEAVPEVCRALIEALAD